MLTECRKALTGECAALIERPWAWAYSVMTGPDQYTVQQLERIAEYGWLWVASLEERPMAFAVVKENRSLLDPNINWMTLLALVMVREERGLDVGRDLLYMLLNLYTEKMHWETWFGDGPECDKIYRVVIEAGFYDDDSRGQKAVGVRSMER